jgi:hypothetical protein
MNSKLSSASWLSSFRQGKRILLDVATVAQRAANFILGCAAMGTLGPERRGRPPISPTHNLNRRFRRVGADMEGQLRHLESGPPTPSRWKD